MMNRWLKNGDDAGLLYEVWEPYPDHPYFEEEYWYKKDMLEDLKSIYSMLKREGIEIEYDPNALIVEPTGLKVMNRMIEELRRIEREITTRAQSQADPLPSSKHSF